MREAGLTAPESTAQVQEDHAGVTGEQEGLGGGRARGSQFRPLQPPSFPLTPSSPLLPEALLSKPGRARGPGCLHPTRRTSFLTSSALLDSSSHGSSSEDPGEEAVPCEPGQKGGSRQVPAYQGWQRGRSGHSSPTTREMMSNLCPNPVSHSGRGQALLAGEKAVQGGRRLSSALTVSLDVHASVSQS